MAEKIDRGLPMELLRNGVVAMSAPRMATQYATAGEIEAFEWPMPLYGFNGIRRAGRGVSARRREQRRYAFPVKLYGQ